MFVNMDLQTEHSPFTA